MFENATPTPPTPVPTQPTPPATAVPLPTSAAAVPSIRTMPTQAPQPRQPTLSERANAEMFKRTGLTGRQKIILIVVIVAVFGGLIGGGIWLYTTLDPLAERSDQSTNSVKTNTTNTIPLQQLDSDKDGVRDIDEKRYGSDPTKTDTDGDGLNDYLEIFQYNTKPTVADSDGDGYLDGNEVNHGYDPNGPGKLND